MALSLHLNDAGCVDGTEHETGKGTCQLTILVFDSGIGGLTVLREARVMMPDKHFTYVADDLAFPYGDWQAADLRKHIVDLFGKLIARFNPELVIIACNTASTLVLDNLRETFPGLEFVGTVPAIKPAAERTRSGLVFCACDTWNS